jgi:tRNA(Ile)-lysidine synthase TilS/MesJ
MPVRCTQCIMPETPGRIQLDASGVCNLCAKQNGAPLGQPVQSGGGLPELLARVDGLRHASTGHYDSLVALSGGKDSTMALHIAVKQLGLRPLAVFIDNGFCVEAMYRNVQNAADSLGVDLFILKPQLVKNLFRHLLKSGSRVYFCRICNGLIDYYIRAIALQHGIKLLISGHTKGQEFLKGTELFWIYRASDAALLEAIKDMPEFSLEAEMFSILAL